MIRVLNEAALPHRADAYGGVELRADYHGYFDFAGAFDGVSRGRVVDCVVQPNWCVVSAFELGGALSDFSSLLYAGDAFGGAEAVASSLEVKADSDTTKAQSRYAHRSRQTEQDESRQLGRLSAG